MRPVIIIDVSGNKPQYDSKWITNKTTVGSITVHACDDVSDIAIYGDSVYINKDMFYYDWPIVIVKDDEGIDWFIPCERTKVDTGEYVFEVGKADVVMLQKVLQS